MSLLGIAEALEIPQENAAQQFGRLKGSLLSPSAGTGEEGGSFFSWQMMILEVIKIHLSL